jgi:hypothetical protein
MWTIDSYEALGAAPDRTDLCGGIFTSTYTWLINYTIVYSLWKRGVFT